MDPITPASVLAAGGAVVSIVFFILQIFFPGIDQIPDAKKQGYNMLATIAVVVAVVLLSCYTEVILIECTQVGIYNLIVMVFSAIAGNAVTYVSLNKVADRTKEAVRPEQQFTPR